MRYVMSNADDIVTRLRGWEVEPYPIPVGACIRNGAVMEEAANEIERLRKIIAGLKGPEMCDPNDPCEMCKE